MGFIDKNLMDGEKIIHRASLHWIIFIRPIVWTVITGFVALRGNAWMQLALQRTPREVLDLFPPAWITFLTGGYTRIPPLAILLIVLIVVPLWIGELLAYLSSEFGVSNKRVLIKTGLFSRHSFETLLSKVEGIGVSQGLLGRIFNYGTIIVTGTGGSKEAFAGIENPLEFRKKVQEQVVSHGPA